MDNNINFGSIWKKQNTGHPPSTEELLKKLKQFKNRNLRKIIFTNLMLISTCVVIALIWINYQPELLTSKIGIILVVLAMVIYLITYNNLFKHFYKVDQAQSNNEYLQTLYKINDKQKFMQTKMLSLYFTLLSSGICLYMVEYAMKMSMISRIIAYSSILIWIGFCWFYVRKKTIKKQQSKIDELISKFQEINKQLED